MVEPTLASGTFLYEEGAGLEDDEVAAYAALRPRALAGLPGGGLADGATLTATDNASDTTLTLVLRHIAPWDEEKAPAGFELAGVVEGAGVAAPAAAAAASESDVEEVPEPAKPARKKRAAAAPARAAAT